MDWIVSYHNSIIQPILFKKILKNSMTKMIYSPSPRLNSLSALFRYVFHSYNRHNRLIAADGSVWLFASYFFHWNVDRKTEWMWTIGPDVVRLAPEIDRSPGLWRAISTRRFAGLLSKKDKPNRIERRRKEIIIRRKIESVLSSFFHPTNTAWNFALICIDLYASFSSPYTLQHAL